MTSSAGREGEVVGQILTKGRELHELYIDWEGVKNPENVADVIHE